MECFYDEKNETTELLKNPSGKVAVIGMACRLPGANNIDEYWDLLSGGKCVTREIPESRIPLDLSREDKLKKYICGYIDDIDKFDSCFFGITPREAIRMDPHQRILLEVVWEAIEDAGIKVEDLAGYDTGVFIGAGAMFGAAHYFMHQINDNTADIYSYTGSEISTLANKISYLFDFRGPCFSVDSACSSSLTIIDEAYLRLCSGKCKVAVVGSSSLLLSSTITSIFKNARLLTSDGRVKTFDEKADGYVRGEGAGVVILKPLENALEDGNDIWAVISGTSINHGGKNGRGFTYPNAEAQKKLIKSACMNASISPSEVYYIEAHGTATPVGDEIELTGIQEAISEGREKNDVCKVGSVKTNFGHLEYAAGIAAFIKTCLMLKNKRLVPSLNYQSINKNVTDRIHNIMVQTTCESWPKDKKLIAGVSSFGIGGSNAHVVLESVDNYVSISQNKHLKKENDNELLVFPFSANDRNALIDIAKKYSMFMKNNKDIDFYDLCYSAGVHRNHLKYRTAVVCKNTDELVSKLDTIANCETDDNVQLSNNSKNTQDLTFVFSDGSDNWIDDVNLIFFQNNYFIETLNKVDKLYRQIYGEALFIIRDKKDIETIYSDLFLNYLYYFIYQITLYRIWEEKKIIPSRMVGYKQSEIVVEYISGRLTLFGAIKLLEQYTKAQEELSCRKFNIMATVDELNDLLSDYEGKAYISAFNSSNIQEVSVDNECVEEFIQELANQQFYFKEITHKSQKTRDIGELDVDSIKEEDVILKFKLYNTTVDQTGQYIEFFKNNWQEIGSQKTNFTDRILEIVMEGCSNFIEIGNDKKMNFYISDIFQSVSKITEREVVISLNCKEETLDSYLIQGIAELYAAGYPIDWTQIYKEGKYIKLPSYAWQNQSYWI